MIKYITADGKEFLHSRDAEKYCEDNGTTFKEVAIKEAEPREEKKKSEKENKED